MFSILRYRGAVPFYFAIFINAVVDLGHKITLQNTIFKVYDDAEQVILTAIVNAIILLPYILFFTPIGQLANRTPKPEMMRIAARISIVLTLMLLAFYRLGWFWLAFLTTFLMSIQSAYYSPAKLGYLKTLFGKDRILEANGLAQSVVIIGILASTVFFSMGFESIYTADMVDSRADIDEALARSVIIASMWPLMVCLILLAVLQLWMVHRVPVIPEINGGPDFIPGNEAPGNLGGTRCLALPHFRIPILGLALFWALGQGVLAIFPAFAKSEAGITNTAIVQGILACSGLGILFGSWLVAQIHNTTHGYHSIVARGLHIAIGGMVIMVVGLFTLTLFRMPGIYAMQFFLIGIASGLLIVPLNAYIQLKANYEVLGSVITCSNLVQNVAMLTTLTFTIAIAFLAVSPASLLLILSVVALLAALLLIPAILSLMRSG